MSGPAHYAYPEIPDVRLYRAFETVVGGYWTKAAYRSWKNRRPLGRVDRDLHVRISRIEDEAVGVRAIWFVRDDGDLPGWDPGAHIDLVLPSGRLRQYSLTSDPDDLSAYRISVRRIDPEAGGGGGSVEAHGLAVGDRLVLKGPRNAFPFVDSRAGYLFVAGGIGITPILPMLRDVVRRGVPYELVYTGRSRATMPFLAEVAEIVGDHEIHLWPDDERAPGSGRRPDAAEIISLAPEGAALYCCGPMPMIEAIRAQIPDPQIDTLHYERFSPPPVLGGHPFRIRLADSGTEVEVGASESALAAVRRVRPAQAYSCQQGFCGTCKVRVLAGEVEHRDHALAAYEREGTMILCVSRAEGTVVIEG